MKKNWLRTPSFMPARCSRQNYIDFFAQWPEHEIAFQKNETGVYKEVVKNPVYLQIASMRRLLGVQMRDARHAT